MPTPFFKTSPFAPIVLAGTLALGCIASPRQATPQPTTSALPTKGENPIGKIPLGQGWSIQYDARFLIDAYPYCERGKLARTVRFTVRHPQLHTHRFRVAVHRGVLTDGSTIGFAVTTSLSGHTAKCQQMRLSSEHAKNLLGSLLHAQLGDAHAELGGARPVLVMQDWNAAVEQVWLDLTRPVQTEGRRLESANGHMGYLAQTFTGATKEDTVNRLRCTVSFLNMVPPPPFAQAAVTTAQCLETDSEQEGTARFQIGLGPMLNHPATPVEVAVTHPHWKGTESLKYRANHGENVALLLTKNATVPKATGYHWPEQRDTEGETLRGAGYGFPENGLLSSWRVAYHTAFREVISLDTYGAALSTWDRGAPLGDENHVLWGIYSAATWPGQAFVPLRFNQLFLRHALRQVAEIASSESQNKNYTQFLTLASLPENTPPGSPQMNDRDAEFWPLGTHAITVGKQQVTVSPWTPHQCKPTSAASTVTAFYKQISLVPGLTRIPPLSILLQAQFARPPLPFFESINQPTGQGHDLFTVRIGRTPGSQCITQLAECNEHENIFDRGSHNPCACKYGCMEQAVNEVLMLIEAYATNGITPISQTQRSQLQDLLTSLRHVPKQN